MKSSTEALVCKVAALEKEVVKMQQQLECNEITKCVYSVREVSQILGVTPKTVYNLIEKGQLRTVELGTVKVLGSSLREKLNMSI